MPLQEIETVLFAIFMVKFEIFSLNLGSIPGNRGEKSVEPDLLDSDKCLSWLLWFSRLSTLVENRRTARNLVRDDMKCTFKNITCTCRGMLA
jgi:hypothetical protein